MELVEVNCPVCSGGDYKVLRPSTLGARPPVFGYKWVPAIRKTYRTVKCNCCSHVYCSPRLKDMYKYYEDVVDRNYLKNEILRIRTAKEVIKTIRRFVPEGRLLDVGCSTGDFLMVAKEFYNAEGLELSGWACDIASGRGLTIHRQELARISQSGSMYDIVTMWGVIEHLEYPAVEISYVNRLLNTGGIVCFWTGDADSIYARLLGRRWWYVLGQHVQLFTRRSLSRLMQDSGFERLYMGVYPYRISFEYLATSLSRYAFVGALARNIFRLMAIQRRQFTLKKSDEMFATFRKVRDIG